MVLSANASKPHPSSTSVPSTSKGPNTITAKSFCCDHPGCKSKPFKLRADFARHRRIHNPNKEYSCPAQGCKRYGVRGFSRKDKLVDHILAGHDDDTIFSCPKERCSAQLTRLLFSIHDGAILSPEHFANLKYYRTCPMPRCGFKIHFTREYERDRLDGLQEHIRNSHDMKGRKNYANTLQERGYDYKSGDITCPLCPVGSFFSNHLAFELHFIDSHTVSSDKSEWCRCDSMPAGLRCSSCLRRLALADSAPQHRETLLSLIPRIESHQMFDDIECKGRY
ncbi:hypothetical protein IQ07DRAFT_361519 [Pyrenochaeta sp. DS3sAY3a]|nr:hypothetical protein IQ07DRAFT_361519 [Pyrenochaeta sp. DS3sAY3a]